MDYLEKIEEGDGDLKSFTTAYKSFGIHIQDDNSVVAKEWAPGAQEVFLTGDFSTYYFLFDTFNIQLSLISITVSLYR